MSEGPSSPEQRSPEPQRPVEAPQPRPVAEPSKPVIPSGTLAAADAAQSRQRLTGVRQRLGGLMGRLQHEKAATPVAESLEPALTSKKVQHPLAVGIAEEVSKKVDHAEGKLEKLRERLKRKYGIEESEVDNYIPQSDLEGAALQKLIDLRNDIVETKWDTVALPKVTEIVEKIDEKSVDSMAQFTSQKYPDVRFMYTTLPVNDIAQEIYKLPEDRVKPTDGAKKIKIFNLVGHHPSPTEEGPWTSQDAVYAAVNTALSKVTGPVQRQRGEKAPIIDVISLGSPAGWGGTVTKEYVQKEQEEGLRVPAEVYAEFIKSIYFKDGKPDENTLYVFEGNSKGAEVARQLAKLLPELRTHVQQVENGKPIPANLQLLLDAPVNYTQADTLLGRINSKIKSLQIPVGFAIEGITEIATNKKLQKALFAGGGFQDTLRQTAAEKGLVVDESDEMRKLQKEARGAEVVALRKPPEEAPSDIRAFDRKGNRDLTTWSPVKLGQMKARGFGDRVPVVQEGSEMVFGLHAGHAVPLARIQVDRFKDRAKTVLRKQAA